MRRLFNLLSLLLVSLLVVHCGGGGTGGATPSPAPNPPAGSVQVTGRVIDGETQAGIANARVDYRVAETGQTGSTTPSGDGSFSFSFPGDGRLEYIVDATGSAPGYVSSELVNARVSPGGAQVETILLVRESATLGSISGRVLDASNNNPIAGAELSLDRGQGTPFGARDGRVGSDAQGGFSFTGLRAGTYTVTALAGGFAVGRRTAITVSTGAVRAQDVVLSPEGGTAVVRIVLTWGAAPRDLDAHLTGPNPSDAGRFHVSFVNRLDSRITPFAGLDVDDRDGNGPETITITRLNSGVYRYSVHDFTNRASAASTELGRSGASVVLYTAAGGRRTFFVPNQSGNLWTVFELSGDIANPTVTERNTMGFAEDFNTIQKPRERE